MREQGMNEFSNEELMKRAEMSLRDAPTSVHIKMVPPMVRDGKVYHPNLTEKGELKKGGK